MEYKKIKSENTQSIIERFDETRKGKVKMNKEVINEIIRLIKVNTDNNLILLKELIEQRARLEKLEQKERGQDVV